MDMLTSSRYAVNGQCIWQARLADRGAIKDKL
jgi:hypothetical protein